jgi:uncharacterized membrane protein YgcG
MITQWRGEVRSFLVCVKPMCNLCLSNVSIHCGAASLHGCCTRLHYGSALVVSVKAALSYWTEAEESTCHKAIPELEAHVILCRDLILWGWPHSLIAVTHLSISIGITFAPVCHTTCTALTCLAGQLKVNWIVVKETVQLGPVWLHGLFTFISVRVGPPLWSGGQRSGGPGSIPGTTRFSGGGSSSGSGTGSTQPREYNWGATW